jgi:hypothetical protein
MLLHLYCFCVSSTLTPVGGLVSNTTRSYFLIYETKGLSLEEVDELYLSVNQAHKSKSFRPQLQFSSKLDPDAGIGANQMRKRNVQQEEFVEKV